MPSLLLVVFLVEVIAHIISAVGAATLNNLLWNAINLMPVSTSQGAAEQRKLQADYLQVRNEMNGTSSQDEFAKWAKLRRKHDKLLEQLEAKKKGLDAARSKFDTYLMVLRILLTRAPQYLIPFWYAKEPMFWLPYGWFPYYAEWIISFPRAPLGSVSIASWQLACTGLIGLISELVIGTMGLVRSAQSRGKGADGKPVSGANSQEKKKEL